MERFLSRVVVSPEALQVVVKPLVVLTSVLNQSHLGPVASLLPMVLHKLWMSVSWLPRRRQSELALGTHRPPPSRAPRVDPGGGGSICHPV